MALLSLIRQEYLPMDDWNKLNANIFEWVAQNVEPVMLDHDLGSPTTAGIAILEAVQKDNRAAQGFVKIVQKSGDLQRLLMFPTIDDEFIGAMIMYWLVKNLFHTTLYMEMQDTIDHLDYLRYSMNRYNTRTDGSASEVQIRIWESQFITNALLHPAFVEARDEIKSNIARDMAQELFGWMPQSKSANFRKSMADEIVETAMLIHEGLSQMTDYYNIHYDSFSIDPNMGEREKASRLWDLRDERVNSTVPMSVLDVLKNIKRIPLANINQSEAETKLHYIGTVFPTLTKLPILYPSEDPSNDLFGKPLDKPKPILAVRQAHPRILVALGEQQAARKEIMRNKSFSLRLYEAAIASAGSST
ncbi:hypothetical protein F4778DRAFT_745455 [Xylariomycetidae sp. FL2044]|nr:hypothetical protein F4778DRAFT_745455 [Xylariomycetidae sp. FL2044]